MKSSKLSECKSESFVWIMTEGVAMFEVVENGDMRLVVYGPVAEKFLDRFFKEESNVDH